jgi:glucosamine-phosphate N-acetyltransferase
MTAPVLTSTTVPDVTKPIMSSTVTPIDIQTDGPLFSTSLISPEVISLLPTDYTIRPMRRSDYNRGYLDVLRVLTTVGDISEEAWNQRYEWITSRNDEYYMLVVCDGADRVVGTGSLIVERKFIHSLGMVGHIEDIAVEKNQQGKKLGLRIIQALDYVAAQVGCYKVCVFFLFFLLAHGSVAVSRYNADLGLQSILDCSEVNEGFYVKCGFKRAGLEMAHYY